MIFYVVGGWGVGVGLNGGALFQYVWQDKCQQVGDTAISHSSHCCGETQSCLEAILGN